MMKFKLKAFRAINNRKVCEQYLAGHQQVLKDYGIENITTNNDIWFELPSVYGIVAYLEGSDEVVGGVRIQLADGKTPLPVETAVGYMDPKIYDIIKKNIDKGTGEICGLWNANKVSGIGLSIILLRAGISMVNQVKLDSLYTICADYTLNMVHKVGFIQEKSLGNDGAFEYPNESYIARVLRKLNSVTLDTAQEYDRERIFFLRDNPEVTCVEQGSKGPFEVSYDLKIKNL